MLEHPARPPVSGWTVLAIAAVVLILVGVALAARGGSGGQDAGSKIAEAESDRAEAIPGALRMPIGTCFEAGPPRVGAPLAIDAIRLIECSEPHHYEVFARFDDPAEASARYPGEDALYEYGSDGCIERFEGVVGVDFASSDFDVSPIQPDPQAWNAGARTIACALVRTDFETMTDSVLQPTG